MQRDRRALRKAVLNYIRKYPKYDLTQKLNAKQRAYWPRTWSEIDEQYTPYLWEDVQEELEVDPTNPMSPSESTRGPDIDITVNQSYVKRCVTFELFVNMEMTQNDIQRSLPARLQTSANSAATTDLLNKVASSKNELYRKIRDFAFMVAL